jgi:uncharacterized membrane protein
MRLSVKEILVITAATGFALATFRLDDPWVVIPMLLVSGIAFLVLCIRHRGKLSNRIALAVVILGVLGFIGWRTLRNLSRVQNHPTTITTIQQNATDSDWSNNVGGKDVNVDCSSTEKQNDKKKSAKR